MDVFAVNNFGDTRSGGLAGPMGLFLIVLMCIATVLLIRNMNKRIRRLPDSFSNSPAREPVAEIAHPEADGDRPAPADGGDVETNRSAQALATEDAEPKVVGDSDGGATPGGRTARG